MAGQPVYIIGAPTFGSTTTQLGPKATLTITRTGDGLYIQSATLDGKNLGGKAWLHVDQIHVAGTHTLALQV